MLLAIDVGNTNITLGVYQENKLLFVSRIATDNKRMEDQYAVEIRLILELHQVKCEDIDGAILSSVVPKLSHDIPAAVQKLFGIDCVIVGTDTVHDLEIVTDMPQETGADLLADCIAGKKFCTWPCIIIDMGTATKMLVLDKQGRFCGAVIAPGLGVSLDALVSNAALLSSVAAKAPRQVMGTNTTHCIQSGIIHGSAAMLDGMCERIEEELGEKCDVIATGGHAREVVHNCRRKIPYSETFLIEGLKIIYDGQAGLKIQ
ncbi:type III pantothenate kinase [Scatolibacter rhodanostii]|uniref:type III pantothenate kinase n=1 Tax=Scatolibacter rhodanostii TaxID=2014781 RepID=UPI000C0751CE|nr:type III pantothenate kinase [Scatolibacter rhodanostii]